MEYKKPLFGAISALALAASLQANASVSQSETHIERAAVPVSANWDLVLDFLMMTNGDLSPAAVAEGVRRMFRDVSAEQAGQMPAFAAGLSTLGLSDQSRSAATEAMLEVLSASQKVDDDTLGTVATALLDHARSGPYRVAQAGDEVCADDDCPPDTTEAIGGNAAGDGGPGGGGYSG